MPPGAGGTARLAPVANFGNEITTAAPKAECVPALAPVVPLKPPPPPKGDLTAEAKSALLPRMAEWYEGRLARADLALSSYQALLAQNPANGK